MEGVNPTVIGPTGYGNDNSSQALGTGLLAAAALGNNKGYGYDNGLGIAGQTGICDLRHDVGMVNSTVKDAECNLAHKIGDAECRLNTSILSSSGDIRREVAKEVGDAKFLLHDNISNLGQNVSNRFALVDVALVRNEYESKLAAERVIKEVSTEVRHQAERTNDKIAHGFEEVREDLCALRNQLTECCCEQEAASATQVGLLNSIISALNVRGNS